MLTISGLKNFYFVQEFTDMRCKAPRMLELIHRRFGRDPYNGDVFIFMSKDRRSWPAVTTYSGPLSVSNSSLK